MTARDRASVIGVVFGVLLAATGCQQELPDPPDPNTEIPPVECDEGAPLSLVRTTADSLFDPASWIEVCTLCPASSIALSMSAQLTEDGPATDIPLLSMWSSDLACAAAIPTVAVPVVDNVTVGITVRSGDRSGTFQQPLVQLPGRGDNPVDLGSSTWVLASGDDDPSAEVFGLGLPLGQLGPAAAETMLIHLGEPDPNGNYPVTLGAAIPPGTLQDPCLPTQLLAEPAQLDQRQLAVAFSSGDLLPRTEDRPPLPLRAGVLQARMSSTGAALQAVSLIALADLSQLEVVTGTPPDVACAALAKEAGEPVCIPCVDPGEGSAGLPVCVPMLWEWPNVIRAATMLQPVDPGSLPPECSDGAR